MASTPVRALHPAENAFSTNRTPTGARLTVAVSEWPGWARLGSSGWTIPMAMTARRPTMKTTVGRRKARAVSPSPRRLSTVSTASSARHSGTVVPASAGNGRRQRGDAGGDGDGDGEGVVHHQRGRRHLGRALPEVGPGHGVGPAPVGVAVDDLAVGDDQQGQQGHDGDGDRQHQVQGGHAGGAEDQHDGLGTVGHRGEGVEGEGGETLEGCDLPVPGLARLEGPTDQDPPRRRQRSRSAGRGLVGRRGGRRRSPARRRGRPGPAGSGRDGTRGIPEVELSTAGFRPDGCRRHADAPPSWPALPSADQPVVHLTWAIAPGRSS